MTVELTVTLDSTELIMIIWMYAELR